MIIQRPTLDSFCCLHYGTLKPTSLTVLESTLLTDHSVSLSLFIALIPPCLLSMCVIDERLLESSESYKAASQRASLEVERLRAENEDLKQQLDAGFACHCCAIYGLYLLTLSVHLLQICHLFVPFSPLMLLVCRWEPGHLACKNLLHQTSFGAMQERRQFNNKMPSYLIVVCNSVSFESR